MKYAAKTGVSVEKTRAEIELILHRYGADSFGYASRPDAAQVEFQCNGRHVRFFLPMPSRDDFRFTPGRGLQRADKLIEKEWEQACRQRWRALCLAIKAKLECVECGISEFDKEFLAHIVDPATNRTVSEIVLPQLIESYENASNKPLLLTDTR